MQKVKCNSVKLKDFVQDFGEQYFSTDRESLFCKLYEVKVAAKKHFTAQQYCYTTTHKNNLSRHSAKDNRQSLLLEKASTTSPSKKT
jgi:hypothetical protein